MADTSHIVIVAGMHRSGTSLAAELLVRLGAFTRDRLLEANEYNLRGYWEDADVVALHDRILSACNRSWGSPESALPMPEGWQSAPETAVLRDELESFLVGGAETATGPWVVKDPRICRLIPLWRDIAQKRGIGLSAVLSVRAPGAVAASLADRDRLPVSFGRVLWLVNHVDLLGGAGELVRGCVSYDRWFESPRQQAETLAGAAGLAPGREAIDAAVSAVVSRDLRHHEQVPGSGMSDRLFSRLQEWAETGVRPADLGRLCTDAGATLADVAGWVGSMTDPAYFAESLEAQVEEFRAAYLKSAARADDLQSLVWRLERPLAALRALRRAVRGGGRR